MSGVMAGLGASLLLASGVPPPTQADVDGLIAHLASPDATTQEDAACGLGRLGRTASRAVPALTAVLERQIVDSAVLAEHARRPREGPLPYCQSIADEMREADFRRAIALLRGAPTHVVGEADDSAIAWAYGPVVWAIRQLGGSEAAGRELLDMFRRDPELRCDQRRVPELMGALGPKALPALEEGLRDEVTQVRYFAVQAIPSLRPLPPDAEKLLQRTIDWDVGDVRSAAVQGLEAVRMHRRHVQEDDEREQRAAAAGRKDWLAEFPSYPGAAKVCSGRVTGSAAGRRREIVFSTYATKDAPAAVVSFYASARRVNAEPGARTLSVASANGNKHVAVHPVSDSSPACGVKPPKDAKTVLIVSEATP